MDIIFNDIEILIDDLERDSQMTREETLKTLYEIKEKIENSINHDDCPPY